jgi:hypothetical protein
VSACQAVTLDGRTMLHMAACSADTATLTALMRWGSLMSFKDSY